MPCPHHDIKIVQRSNRQSSVAAAAYQSGERLFSEYDQKQKYYSEKRGIVHTEIMLPPHAPPEYADRNTLWNAAEAVEKQWNSQLARRIVLAIPREIPPEQHADLIRDYTIIGAADEYGSGLTLDRPALLKVTEAVVTGKVDVVLVHSLTRIGRKWGMTQSYIDLLTRHKVKLLCIRDRLLFDENGAAPILTIKNAECPL